MRGESESEVSSCWRKWGEGERVEEQSAKSCRLSVLYWLYQIRKLLICSRNERELEGQGCNVGRGFRERRFEQAAEHLLGFDCSSTLAECITTPP